jgi:phenylacetate-CoA ligase
VRVEARPGTAGADERAASGRVLGGLVKDSIGVSVAVDVTEPGLVERSLGKAQRIVDLRDPT